MNKKDLIEFRKANYWRGFRAACLLFVPVIIFFVVVVDLLIKTVE